MVLKKAVALDPDNGYYLDSLGWAFYKQENYEEAHRWLEKATAQVPEDAVVLDHYGDVLSALGDTEAARKAWERALKADPEAPGPRSKLSRD